MAYDERGEAARLQAERLAVQAIPSAVRRLRKIVEDPYSPEAAAIAAATALLDRAIGKPRQSTVHQVTLDAGQSFVTALRDLATRPALPEDLTRDKLLEMQAKEIDPETGLPVPAPGIKPKREPKQLGAPTGKPRAKVELPPIPDQPEDPPAVGTPEGEEAQVPPTSTDQPKIPEKFSENFSVDEPTVQYGTVPPLTLGQGALPAHNGVENGKENQGLTGVRGPEGPGTRRRGPAR